MTYAGQEKVDINNVALHSKHVMDSPYALPLSPSEISLQGLDTHIATGLAARQEQAQVALYQLAPGSAVNRHPAIAPIRVRQWPTSTTSQTAASLQTETHAATGQQLITLQIHDADATDPLDAHLCSFWDTRKLFFMHPHDMTAHGLTEGGSVLISAATQGVTPRAMVRLRVVPYDVPRGTARGYFRECAPLVTAESCAAAAPLGIPVHVVSAAH